MENDDLLRLAFVKRLSRLVESGEHNTHQTSRAAGLGPSHLAMMLQGKVKNPSLATLRALHVVFNASLDWLLLGLGDEPSPYKVRAAVGRAHAAISVAARRSARALAKAERDAHE